MPLRDDLTRKSWMHDPRLNAIAAWIVAALLVPIVTYALVQAVRKGQWTELEFGATFIILIVLPNVHEAAINEKLAKDSTDSSLPQIFADEFIRWKKIYAWGSIIWMIIYFSYAITEHKDIGTGWFILPYLFIVMPLMVRRSNSKSALESQFRLQQSAERRKQDTQRATL